MRSAPPPAALALIALFAFGTAQASPSFARKYNVSCQSCHAHAYPELNALGREFKENGFQLPAGAEPAYADPQAQAPGTIDERLGLLRELPLAARLVGHVEVPADAAATSRNTVNLKLLDNLYLMGGGAVYPDVSVFFSATVAPYSGLHHAAIGVHNLFFGEGHLNLRAGQLLLLDFLQPEHRAINKQGNIGAMTRVGLNPTYLDSSQLGVDVYGRVFDRHLFYELAVVQGAQGPDGLTDLDSNKDLFGQLQFWFHDENMLGVLGYYGRTQITDDSSQVQVRFTDPMWIVGADAELHFGPLGLFGYALYGRHQNPYGIGVAASYLGMRGDVTYAISPRWLTRLRYDGVLSRDDAALERQSASAHLTYLVLTNFRASAEFVADLKTFNRSTGYLVLDLAL